MTMTTVRQRLFSSLNLIFIVLNMIHILIAKYKTTKENTCTTIQMVSGGPFLSNQTDPLKQNDTEYLTQQNSTVPSSYLIVTSDDRLIMFIRVDDLL
jgi:hypothetical protein